MSHLPRRPLAAALAAVIVAGCGSSDTPVAGALGGGSGSVASGQAAAALCDKPRSGTDPDTRRPYPDRKGTLADEQAWLHGFMESLYLWYREIPAADPGAYATVDAYFKALLTPSRTASGKLKDQFSFTMPTADWLAFSQAGVDAGYGITWVLLSRYPPRRGVVAHVEPGSPADLQGVKRGAEVVKVDGVVLADGADVATLNAGMFPTALGARHVITFLEAGVPRDVTLVSAAVTTTPVPTVKVLATPGGSVGYVLFNDHIATAEAQLFAAVTSLRGAGVKDVVLDLRYNGGGYLTIASELAFMLAGPAATAGKTFERMAFNDRYPGFNPVEQRAIDPTPFQATAVGLSVAEGTPLPSLAGLTRLFVVTGPGTCSASEAVVNGLRGIGVQVIQIGATTCGKPYGFYPQDNCGTTYFAIEFQGVNAQGFGDYPDGFSPGAAGPAGLPGCAVADDFGHALGDPAEARLAAALTWAATGACPPATLPLTAAGQPAAPRGHGPVGRPPWRENRILGR